MMELETAAHAPAEDGACAGQRALVPVATPKPRTPAAPNKKKRKAKRKAKRKLVRWSAKREEMFVETLAQTGNVSEAVRVSELSETNVYRRRRTSEAFRERWAVALREGFAKLETLMLERALAGTEKPVWHGGKQVGTIHSFDNRTCLALLAAHRGSVTGAVPMTAEIGEAAMRAAVSARLAEMNLRMGGNG